MKFRELAIGDKFISVYPDYGSFFAYEKKSKSTAYTLSVDNNRNLTRDSGGAISKFSPAFAVYRLEG